MCRAIASRVTAQITRSVNADQHIVRSAHRRAGTVARGVGAVSAVSGL